MNGLRQTAWMRYLPDGTTNTTFAIAAGLRKSDGITAGVRAVRLDEFVSPGESIWRGAEFKFFGTDANNETIAYRLWVFRDVGRTKGGAYDLDLFGTGTATLSSGAACLGSEPNVTETNLVKSGEMIADTLTFVRTTTATTPKGPADIIENTYGMSFTAQAYSPANDTPSLLIVPDFGRVAGFILEFDLGTAALANALFRLTR